MKKIDVKRNALQRAMENTQKTITDLKTEISRIQTGEMDMDEGQFDLVQRSQDEAAHEIIDKLTEQLQFAMKEMQLLESMKVSEPLLDTVAPGAIVLTDQKNFFVSVGVDDFKVNGYEILGISTEAPIYEVMKGKQKGDRFDFRGIPYRIREVF